MLEKGLILHETSSVLMSYGRKLWSDQFRSRSAVTNYCYSGDRWAYFEVIVGRVFLRGKKLYLRAVN